LSASDTCLHVQQTLQQDAANAFDDLFATAASS
jgi:hypothetical protein